MDFSLYKRTKHYYGGTEQKIGIEIAGIEYMLKFQKFSEFGPCYNHVSEYIGSHVFDLLGFDVQQTILGTYDDAHVVACKNFITDGFQFVPFNDVGESSLEQDKDSYSYTYEDIMKMLEDNKKLTNVEETISVFWQMFIVDALLGNFDRHGANWGFLKKNNKYTIAPIFDNGSCLYPKMSDETLMQTIIDSEDETNQRVYGFPNSQIKIGKRKSSYFEVVNCLEFDECNKALIEIFPRISLIDIYKVIEDCNLSIIHKDFYKHMINTRYQKILEDSYKKLK